MHVYKIEAIIILLLSVFFLWSCDHKPTGPTPPVKPSKYLLYATAGSKETATEQSAVWVIDPENDMVIDTIWVNSPDIREIDVSPDGRWLAVNNGYYGDSTYIYDLLERAQTTTLPWSKCKLVFTDKYLLGFTSGTILYFNPQTLEVKQETTDQPNFIPAYLLTYPTVLYSKGIIYGYDLFNCDSYSHTSVLCEKRFAAWNPENNTLGQEWPNAFFDSLRSLPRRFDISKNKRLFVKAGTRVGCFNLHYGTWSWTALVPAYTGDIELSPDDQTLCYTEPAWPPITYTNYLQVRDAKTYRLKTLISLSQPPSYATINYSNFEIEFVPPNKCYIASGGYNSSEDGLLVFDSQTWEKLRTIDLFTKHLKRGVVPSSN